MLASTERGLQSLMNKLNDTAKKLNINISIQKTKTMVMGKDGGGVVNNTIDGQRVQQVESFKYLGAIISENGRSLNDVKTTITLGRDAFNKRNEFLTKRLSRTLKTRMVKVLVSPVVLYRCEHRGCGELRSTN